MTTGHFDEELKKVGYALPKTPMSINIYEHIANKNEISSLKQQFELTSVYISSYILIIKFKIITLNIIKLVFYY